MFDAASIEAKNSRHIFAPVIAAEATQIPEAGHYKN